LASVAAPFLLGAIVGAIASGRIRVEGDAVPLVRGGFVAPWLALFPLTVGGFCLALCSFLAATYLAAEVTEPALRQDFRRRALGAGIAVGVCALGAFVTSASGAPRIHAGLRAPGWAWPFHAATGATAVGALIALARQRFAI